MTTKKAQMEQELSEDDLNKATGGSNTSTRPETILQPKPTDPFIP